MVRGSGDWRPVEEEISGSQSSRKGDGGGLSCAEQAGESVAGLEARLCRGAVEEAVLCYAIRAARYKGGASRAGSRQRSGRAKRSRRLANP